MKTLIDKDVTSLTIEELVTILRMLNSSYRVGTPLVSDNIYDTVYVEELRKRDPTHSFLNSVEPEHIGSDKVKHKTPMLSLDKAYTVEEIKAWMIKVTDKCGTVVFNATSKLDGVAANWDTKVLSTRGNGLVGTNITHMVDKGLYMVGAGLGEIVVDKKYYIQHLSEVYTHPRNFIAGAIGAKTMRDEVVKAIKDKAIRFIAYDELKCATMTYTTTTSLKDIERLEEEILNDTKYPIDGVVYSIKDVSVRNTLGATNHHPLWAIAKKRQGDTEDSIVRSITWQIGRTGRLTPVVNISPISLSGATIARVTGHNARYVIDNKISVDSVVTIVRSGEVIPKIVNVIPSSIIDNIIITKCPRCTETLTLMKIDLVCTNVKCVGQIEAKLVHFFDVLSNIKEFGRATIHKVVEYGVTTIDGVYGLTKDDFIKMQLGKKMSNKLVRELKQSRVKEIEDWRFLAAFGIHTLGRGDSRKLLSLCDISKVDKLTLSDITEMDGFAKVSGTAIIKGIAEQWDTISTLLKGGFNLTKVVRVKSNITGKRIVFTGTAPVSRDFIMKDMLSKGATLQSSVNAKTDYLVVSARVGISKVNKAKSLGITIITYDEYTRL